MKKIIILAALVIGVFCSAIFQPSLTLRRETRRREVTHRNN